MREGLGECHFLSLPQPPFSNYTRGCSSILNAPLRGKRNDYSGWKCVFVCQIDLPPTTGKIIAPREPSFPLRLRSDSPVDDFSQRIVRSSHWVVQ